MEIVVPELGESIVEATVARWLKKEGDPVSVGEPVVELETDKVDLEVGAKEDGVLTKITHQEGEDVQVGEVLGVIEPAEGAPPAKAAPEAPQAAEEKPAEEPEPEPETEKPPAPEEIGLAHAEKAPRGDGREREAAAKKVAISATPVARRMAEERGIDLSRVAPSGPGQRVTKQDVEQFLERGGAAVEEAPEPAAQPQASPTPRREPAPTGEAPAIRFEEDRKEERVRMTRRRRTIATRLVEAQQNAAILTTFNDVNMSQVIEVRNRWKETFQERYGVKLGFMSFFVKASVAALKQFPRLNAEVDGDEIVLKHYYDIGIAIGAEEGLVVPVLRNADRMSFAEIEQEIRDYIEKTRSGNLAIEDLIGGTFSITNGGVFGSLLSTPILNPPQVGILGLHRIEDRPVAVDGQVQIQPMMYMALSYDHRIVDGREAVQFLGLVKELIEDPERLMLEA